MNAECQPSFLTSVGGGMCDSLLLSHYGLRRHPFTDRTAEKSELAQQATYVHADLKGKWARYTTTTTIPPRATPTTAVWGNWCLYLCLDLRGVDAVGDDVQASRPTRAPIYSLASGARVRPPSACRLSKPTISTTALRWMQTTWR